ncbi:MAG: ribosome-associated translation inhibitor RaiA [Alphaproteobacteria bacterium]
MELTIRGKQVEIGNALREHVEGTLPASIGKYFDNTTDAAVTFSKQGSAFLADIQVHVSKRVIVQGSGKGKDAYFALDEAAEHALKRLRRYKRRLKDHKSQLSNKEIWPSMQYVIQPEPLVENDSLEVEEPNKPVIVAEMPDTVEQLSVEEAVMRMDLAHIPAMMFKNTNSGRINMIYVRSDGNIGWVDPAEKS